MNLVLVFMFFKSCRECIYIRRQFPTKFSCIYYNIPIIENSTICNKYKLKNIDM